MTKWQVELTGHTFDLEELPRLLTTPELRVVEQEGKYFLEAEQFESLAKSKDVHAVALALLPLINGVARLKHRSFRNVDVGALRENDEDGRRRQHVVLGVATLEARSKVSAVAIKVGEEEPKPPAPGSLDSDEWIRRSSSNSHASRALALWGGRHDPVSLWKVWELLRDHSGVVIDRDLRRRFRPALNDRAVAGEDARHEVPSRQYPVEPDTMSMAEAEAFIGDILIRWLGRQP
jgi:hypothetical protein